jgi:orotidine-5'-phosphate decarboxylase
MIIKIDTNSFDDLRQSVMTFSDKLLSAVPNGIGVCVGLDPTLDKLPEIFRNSTEPLYRFNLEIIAATAEAAAAYKPNLAFYERFGPDGLKQLADTIKAIPHDKMIILDAKRGDIGSTATAYADALFETLGGDAATVNPYLGSDALAPFVEREDHGAYVLAVTSNPGGADLQVLQVEGIPLYIHVIRLCRRLNKYNNVGLVVGATRPDLWPQLLDEAGDLPLLVPGVGAQGGDPRILRQLLSGYPAPVLVNSSRGIIFASSGKDFGQAARAAALRLKDELLG